MCIIFHPPRRLFFNYYKLRSIYLIIKLWWLETFTLCTLKNLTNLTSWKIWLLMIQKYRDIRIFGISIIYFKKFKEKRGKSVSSNSSVQTLVERHYISERKLIRCQYVSPVEPVYIDTRVYDLQSSVANSTQWLHDVLATYVFSDWALFGLAANTDLANMTRNGGHFNGSWKQLFALGETFSNVPLLKAYSIFEAEMPFRCLTLRRS